MRTLPDKYFELAICDPPYGDALGSEEITPPDVRYNRFGGRFDKYKPQTAPPHSGSQSDTAERGSASTEAIQPLRGECSTDTRNSYHFNGSNFKRYKEIPPPESQPRMGGERYATYKDAHERRADAEILTLFR